MHELRIAESIMQSALEEMTRRNLHSITAIGLRIGALSGVNISSLEFGFESIIPETALAHAKLHIEEVPVRGECSNCGKDFEVNEFIFVCPHCYSTNINITAGQELDLVYIEAE
ncbi:MAG: hydrogenase maturation nickel metallochaperone HypA [bacterium]|jgi:hydrogenase nickel incorporation protein HypA/HybF